MKTRVPDDVKKIQEGLISDGRCIGCEKVLKDSDIVRRGLCAACYQAAHRAMKAGRRSEGQLIREGKLLPAESGGRPSENKFTRELSER